MTTVRAKFVLNSIERSKHWDKAKGELFALKFTAVTATNEENKQFFEATPNGQLTVGTVKPEIAEGMVLGAEYFVDITLAE